MLLRSRKLPWASKLVSMIEILIASTVFAVRLIAAEDNGCRLTDSLSDNTRRAFAHVLVTLLSWPPSSAPPTPSAAFPSSYRRPGHLCPDFSF